MAAADFTKLRNNKEIILMGRKKVEMTQAEFDQAMIEWLEKGHEYNHRNESVFYIGPAKDEWTNNPKGITYQGALPKFYLDNPKLRKIKEVSYNCNNHTLRLEPITIQAAIEYIQINTPDWKQIKPLKLNVKPHGYWACEKCQVWFIGTVEVSSQNKCPKCGNPRPDRFDPQNPGLWANFQFIGPDEGEI
jgi:hypothetical protein